jgi:putative YhbY family RNA-binding protein
MTTSPTTLRELKARSQKIKPAIRIGKNGLDAAFYRTLDDLLTRQELVKVKFDSCKEDKKSLVPEIAAQSNSQVILFVGHTVTLHRKRAAQTPAESPE